jgi:hypothetical protein
VVRVLPFWVFQQQEFDLHDPGFVGISLFALHEEQVL